MTRVFNLASIATVFLLSSPASEGVTCYDCISSDDARSQSVDLTNHISAARHVSHPPDAACGTSKPSSKASCTLGCYKQEQQVGGKTIYRKGCRDPSHPSSGCREADGLQCYCTTELCNQSYLVKQQWVMLAISLVISLYHFLPYGFSRY